MTHHAVRSSPLLALLLGAAASAAPPSGAFTPLGNLGGAEMSSDAWAISRDGSTIVGGSASPESNPQDAAFRLFVGGVMGPLAPGVDAQGRPNNDLPGGVYLSRALGVCLDGGIAVGYSAYNGVRTHAIRVGFGDTHLVDLGNIANQTPALDPLNDVSIAEGISDFAQIAVGRGFRQATNSAEACYWLGTQPGAFGIGDLPGGITRSDAHGVSGDGLVIVGEGNSASGREAFRWTAGEGMQGLGDAPGGAFDSTAYAASTNGSIIVGYATTAAGAEAARWSSGVLRTLGDLPGGAVSAVAYGVSGDGNVVVGSGDAGLRDNSIPGFPIPISEAFVWDPRHGMRKLAQVLGADLPTGWVLNSANAVTVTSSATLIVGSGTDPQGNNQAFLATLPRFCPADANDSGSVTVQDIFDFLAAYFSSSPIADVNASGSVTVQDIFDFLVAYFGGC